PVVMWQGAGVAVQPLPELMEILAAPADRGDGALARLASALQGRLAGQHQLAGAAGGFEEIALGELLGLVYHQQVELPATGSGFAEIRVGGQAGGRGG